MIWCSSSGPSYQQKVKERQRQKTKDKRKSDGRGEGSKQFANISSFCHGTICDTIGKR
jgi:hypothetical protein